MMFIVLTDHVFAEHEHIFSYSSQLEGINVLIQALLLSPDTFIWSSFEGSRCILCCLWYLFELRPLL